MKNVVLTAALISALAACGSPNDEVVPPHEDANASEVLADTAPSIEAIDGPAITSPVRVSGDPIRGPEGLEQKCHAGVAKEVGAPVLGTNHIEESEAAIEIYVNVEGAEAPWKCLGYSDGTIGEIMYTGSEGGA